MSFTVVRRALAASEIDCGFAGEAPRAPDGVPSSDAGRAERYDIVEVTNV